MYTPVYLFIGLRYLWNAHLPIFKKFITVLSIIGISISIASIIIIISIINGFEEHFKRHILSFIPHLIITNEQHCINKINFPKKILTLHNVKNVSECINHEVIIKSKNNFTMGELIGIDKQNYDNVQSYKIKHLFNLIKPYQKNVVIGIKLAKKLHVSIGDTIQLFFLKKKKNIFNTHFLKENNFTITAFFSTDSEADYYQIIMNKEDSLQFLKLPNNYVTGWRIWLKNPMYFNIDNIKNLTKNFIILDWKSQKGEVFKEMIIEKYIMFFLFFLIFLVSVLNIFITLTIHTIDKRNNIAILKSQGLSNWKIVLVFVILGSSTTVIGSVLGTITSIVLIIQHNFLISLIRLFFDEIDFSIYLIPNQIFFINFISIFITICATLYPSLNAIKMKPAKILSYE
ncbi:FtsX-like permease family protein [Buchnera aphidicola (Hyadaphis tataricae)]|uniref:FtsX-like permease family protein n=1 Tax=Buchnera aphidicola (Hyadaphis tataricae) TaxID=1241859 RepID=A0A4D6YAY5_9GAMM|nr:FtsX-like permease family protein [Buchnera aphidicola]QCI21595.1 FtsX-like permease family protein [Buchnera aphidicola (Hyadaphis tataricae)]